MTPEQVEKQVRNSWAEFYRGWKAARRNLPCTGKSELWQEGWKHYKNNW